MEVDHYNFLGLPSGEEGSRLTLDEISRAYRRKTLELHPDKRPDDPHAHTNFLKLQSSYEILKHEDTRKVFDDHLLRLNREKQRKSQFNSKRRKMMADLQERERAASVHGDDNSEDERIVEAFRQEVREIRSRYAANWNRTPVPTAATHETTLNLSWEGNGDYYSEDTLRKLFTSLGKVEYVVPPRPKRGISGITWRALVVLKHHGHLSPSDVDIICGGLIPPLRVLPIPKA